MQKHKYGNQDNEMIWESLMTRSTPAQKKHMDDLLESDLKYIEEFLIAEGLMDKVKQGFGAVKDFASNKLLKPIVDMIVGALAKDPKLGAQAAQAAEGGPEQLAALAQQQGDPSVLPSIQAAPAAGGAMAAEGYINQFSMNEMICEALVSEGIISSDRSQLIQEKYYRSTINELHSQLPQRDAGCPWMPAGVVTERAGPAADSARQIATLIKSGGNIKKVFNSLLSDDESGFGEYLQNVWKVSEDAVEQKKAQVQRAQANYARGAGSPEAEGTPKAGGGAPEDQWIQDYELPEPPGEGEAPEAPDGGGAPEAPDGGGAPVPGAEGETPTDPNATPAPGAEGAGQAPGTPDPADKPQGILSKIMGFMKANKGIMTGAVALGVLGLMMTNPATAAIALPALKTGLAGAGLGFAKGAATTQGGVKDRVMGGLNQAGKTGAMAAGASAVAGGIGAAMDGAGDAGEPVGAQGPEGPEGPEADAPEVDTAANPLAKPAGSQIEGDFEADARGARNNPATAALAPEPGSKIEGDFRADAANMQNNPAATPQDDSIYTGEQPAGAEAPVAPTEPEEEEGFFKKLFKGSNKTAANKLAGSMNRR